MSKGFVSLHNHTQYSLLDGLASVEEYLSRAQGLQQPAIGITDHGSMGGINRALSQSREYGITVIPGIEAYVAPENPLGAKVREPVYYGGESQRGSDVSARGAYLHLTMWAHNQEGLTNLFRLSEYAGRTENFRSKGRMDWDSIAQNSNGIIVGTGCPSSEISTRLRLGQKKEAYEYLDRLIQTFGKENVFIEIMDHHMQSSLERDLIVKQLEMAKAFPQVGLLATNDCHYAHPGDAKHHEEFLCVQSGHKMSDAPRRDNGEGTRFAFDGTEYYLKDYGEMEKLFPLDEFPGALENTLLIAERCKDISIGYDPHLKPKAPVPDGFRSADEYIKQRMKEGLAYRWPSLFEYKNGKLVVLRPKDELTKRIQQELKKQYQTIKSSDFVDYMLVVNDYVKSAKEKHSVRDENGTILASAVGPGRGSAAGSLISYLLDTTTVDPIEYELIAERFLTPGRGATLEIEYDDGSKDVVNVADVATVKGKKKYAYELEVGDIVEGMKANES